MFFPWLLSRELRNTLVFRNGAVRIDIGAKSALRFRPGSKLHKGLEQLSQDADVRVLLINIRSIDMGWAELQELRSRLQKNREAGKILFAQLHTMDKRALYLASIADTVWLLPAAEILWIPSGMRRLFLGALFQRLGLKADVEAAGAFKSAGEEYSRQYPSSENREQLSSLLNDLEQQMVSAIAASRGIDPTVLTHAYSESPISGERALELGLVDELRYDDQAVERVSEYVMNESEPMGIVSYSRLLSWQRWFEAWGDRRKSIAVLHLNGVITDAEDGRGITLSGLDALLQRVEMLPRCKAIILAINSPGGSALASDQLHRLIERAKSKRVVVACFGNVAASGGYYLAASANAIVAQPGTITGSIGVVGGKLVIGDALSRLDINAELVGSAESDFMNPYRPFTDEQRIRFRGFLQRTYNRFIEVVAGGRMKSLDSVDAVAQGRVWTGKQALEHGLIDTLGGLDVAVAEACRRVSLDPANVKIRHLRIRQPLKQRLRQQVGAIMGLSPSTNTCSPELLRALGSEQFPFVQELYSHPLEPLMMLPEWKQLK